MALNLPSKAERMKALKARRAAQGKTVTAASRKANTAKVRSGIKKGKSAISKMRKAAPKRPAIRKTVAKKAPAKSNSSNMTPSGTMSYADQPARDAVAKESAKQYKKNQQKAATQAVAKQSRKQYNKQEAAAARKNRKSSNLSTRSKQARADIGSKVKKAGKAIKSAVGSVGDRITASSAKRKMYYDRMTGK